MDDKHIEELLRRCWTPSPPDGMRERVLRRSREGLFSRQARPAVLGMARWKLALTGLGILVILFANISDSARQDRLSAMMGRANRNLPMVCKFSLQQYRHDVYEHLVGKRTPYDLQGDDLL